MNSGKNNTVQLLPVLYTGVQNTPEVQVIIRTVLTHMLAHFQTHAGLHVFTYQIVKACVVW